MYLGFFPLREKLRLAGLLSLCTRVLNSESGAGQYAYLLLWFPSFYPEPPAPHPKAFSSTSPSYQEGICNTHFLPSFLRRTLVFPFLWGIVAEELEMLRVLDSEQNLNCSS